MKPNTALALILCLALVPKTAHGVSSYTIVELEGMNLPLAINDLGQIVGARGRSGALSATLWSDGEVIDLGELASRHSIARDINNLGQVAGQAETDSSFSESYSAVVWADGQMTEIGVEPGAEYVFLAANAINDLGQVGGFRQREQPGYVEQRGFLWSPIKDLLVMETGDSQTSSMVEAVNDLGEAAGIWWSPHEGNWPAVWRDGRLTILNGLPPGATGG